MLRIRRITGALLLFAAGGLWAQTPDTAILRGQVTDQTNAAVSNADVLLTNTVSGLHREVITPADGEFSFAGLSAAGTYDILEQVPVLNSF
jgi:hypothetical protein